MNKEERVYICILRMDKARQMLSSAKIMFSYGDHATACNRCYYAVFHAMRAVLALDDIEEHRHSHLISEFRRNYLKTNILDRSLSEIIGSSFQVRNESDYDDMWSISAEDVAEQIDNAQIFLSSIERYIRTRGVEL